MPICEYGCRQEAKYQFKNGKWCCSEKWQKCPANKKRVKLQTLGKNNPMFGKKHSKKTKQKIRIKGLGRTSWNKGIPRKPKTKEILKEKLKGREPWNKGKKVYSYRRSIEYIKRKYPLFSKIEEMRYKPDESQEKRVIQVHCKNHNCPNSKEKDGWFTPTGRQIEARLNALENKSVDLNYFYCSEECKDQCPLYGLQSDPFKQNKKIYTLQEYQTFRKFVLERDNYICQFCGGKATYVHHERPQKLEPFFALDPDFAWSCCKKCHYEKGHKDECSTGQLANIICS